MITKCLQRLKTGHVGNEMLPILKDGTIIFSLSFSLCPSLLRFLSE